PAPAGGAAGAGNRRGTAAARPGAGAPRGPTGNQGGAMKGVGLVDLSARGRLLLRGADRVRFLQGMVTADVAALADGASCRAAMLTPKGRGVADMLIRAEPDGFLIPTDPEARPPLGDRLGPHVVTGR